MVSYEALTAHFICFCSALTSKQTSADVSVSVDILTLPSGATPAFKSRKASADSAATGPVSDMFNIIRGLLGPDIVKTTQGVYRFDLSGTYDVFKTSELKFYGFQSMSAIWNTLQNVFFVPLNNKQ